MPRDRIEAAIKRGAGNVDTDNYESIRYEGYGPGGVAIIVEALTDNRNRTASDIRSAFTKFGGNLGETNSVSRLFERKGVVAFPLAVATPEVMFEAALEAGADDVTTDADGHEVVSATESFPTVRDALEARFGAPSLARVSWRPVTTVPVDAATAETLVRMLDLIEDNDDVQTVSANFEIADEVMARLTA